jgi:hypothetical protein
MTTGWALADHVFSTGKDWERKLAPSRCGCCCTICNEDDGETWSIISSDDLRVKSAENPA